LLFPTNNRVLSHNLICITHRDVVFRRRVNELICDRRTVVMTSGVGKGSGDIPGYDNLIYLTEA
jgi:hypothetical protein